jgi:Skp family chaperone for outer membrane proteins
MLKAKSVILVATLLALAPSSWAQQQQQPLLDGRIAVINTAIFPEKIGELKQKYDQVANQFKDRYQRLQDLDQQVKDLEKEISLKGPTLSPDKLQEMRDRYETLKRQGSRELEDYQADYQKALDAAINPLREKLSQFMQRYATQRGIVLILDLPGAFQTGTLAYWNSAVDITEDFISEYNKANPVPAAPAQPAATPAPKPAKP